MRLDGDGDLTTRERRAQPPQPQSVEDLARRRHDGGADLGLGNGRWHAATIDGERSAVVSSGLLHSVRALRNERACVAVVFPSLLPAVSYAGMAGAGADWRVDGTLGPRDESQ